MWSVYYLIHSTLASTAVKKIFNTPSIYRLSYSIISSLLLIPIVRYISNNRTFLFEMELSMQVPGLFLTVSGMVLVLFSFQYFSGLVFLGVKSSTNGPLIEKGLHRYMRHPIYSGTIFTILGVWLMAPTSELLATLTITLAYLPIGIYFEERKLIAEFGEDYQRYKKRIPAILPRLLF